VRSLVAHADDNLILAQRLAEWISNAPELEEDIAIGNIGLDHLGVARSLYTHVCDLEGMGRNEDDLAMRRSEREFMSLLLVEQPNGDFAQTMVRGMLFDSYQLELWADLAVSDDDTLAGIADRALKETRYHLRHSSAWVVRLGDGTDESHHRAQSAVNELWRFTGEMFEDGAEGYRPAWEDRVTGILEEAGLVKQVRDGIKILGDGELKAALTVQAHAFSKSAREKILQAGGKVEVLGSAT